MTSKLRDRILTERITEPSQLSEAEQALVRRDGELQALLAENRVLAAEAGTDSGAPPRMAVLQAAMREGGESVREHRMTFFERLFAGRRPVAQFGLAMLLVAAFSFAYMGYMVVDNSPAWSMTTGNVLEYQLGEISGEDALQPILDQYVAKVKEAKAELYGDAASEKKTVMISVNVEANADGDGAEEVTSASLVVSLVDDDPALLELIQAKIAEIPGAPAATVQSAIWFYGPEGPGQGGMRFKVEDQIFNFPETATEEEIESTIKAWLAENRPEKEFVVDISIERETDAEGREKVRVEAKIHEVGEEASSTSAETPAHEPTER